MKFLAFSLPTLLSASVANSDTRRPAKNSKKAIMSLCIIGNSLAERMQPDGWLEALIQARFPKHELVFRNLGFSGDEVASFT